MTQAGRSRRVLWIAAALVLLGGGCAILILPATTLRGVDYKVSAHRIPAYVKTIEFLQRHFGYERLVSVICGGKTSDEDCVMAIFEWTHRNVRPTPVGWPVIDDHPLNIVTRGYGQDDQIADVFVILTGYARVPAFFKWLHDPARTRRLVLAFARLDGRWVAFDVANHVAFRNRRSRLADVTELMRDSSLVDEQTRNLDLAGIPYSAFMSADQLIPFTVRRPFRGEMQQPWPRLRYELRHAVGLESE